MTKTNSDNMKYETRVYRFHQAVAFQTSLNEGGTIYIKPSEARSIAIALLRFADDIDKTKFTDSTLGTLTITHS